MSDEASEARLAYLEDRLRSAHPVERVCLSFTQALENAKAATELAVNISSTDVRDRQKCVNEAHAKTMKCHAWVSELQASLDTHNTDEQVRRQAEDFFGLYAIILELLTSADMSLRDDSESSVRLLQKVQNLLEERLRYWQQVWDVVRATLTTN